MLLGESSSTDSDGIINSCLMECDRIHLSLHDIDLTTLGDRLLREMESVEDRALVEYMGSRRVQIFRETIIHDASSEGNSMSHRIRYREDDTTIELVPRLTDKKS